MQQKLVVYERKSGKRPFWDWLTNLKDRKGKAVIQARLERIELRNFGNCRGVGGGVTELKIDFGAGYRVYFGKQGANVVLLLCGGDKSTQTADIATATKLWKEYCNAN